MNRTLSIVILCAVSCFGAGQTGAGQTTITEYRIPTVASFPEAILLGPDGALWFTETATDKIGRITTAGVFKEYQLPGTSPTGQAKDAPWDLIIGPDGAIWITENSSNKIARMTTDGVFTNEYTIPTADANARRITVGPDNNMWFTEYHGNNIGRLTTSGVFTEFPIPTPNSTPSGITAGPDGAIWFNENGGNQIVRMTTDGVITNSYPVPTPNSVLGQILTGPDGALWVTENISNKIGRITTAGVLTEWTMPSPATVPTGLVVGPDGALWFTEWAHAANNIGRITTSGVITEFAIPSASSYPWEIAVGPDNHLWFTEYGTNRIGKLPACGIGLTASYSAGTLTMGFNLGITTPAVWNTWVRKGRTSTTLWNEPVAAQVPPAFASRQVPLAPEGNIAVFSGLFEANGTNICAEQSQIINTGH